MTPGKNKPSITSERNSQNAVKRLRQYMLAHTTWLIAKMDPLKYIFEKPALTGQIARWLSKEAPWLIS
ncbi:hypothetical protein CR513_59606, partial [Mucuna pruriens]